MASKLSKKNLAAEQKRSHAQLETSAIPYFIVQAAARLFRQHGFANVSMREIAEAVNLSKAGLYHHCPSKEGLLTEMTRLCGELLIRQLGSSQVSGASPLERLQTFIETRMQVIAEHQDLFTIIWQERPLLNGPAFSKVAIAAERYRDGVRLLILQAQKSGEIRKDVDPHLLMLAIDGMTGWAYIWYRGSGKREPRHIAETFWSFLTRGILS